MVVPMFLNNAHLCFIDGEIMRIPHQTLGNNPTIPLRRSPFNQWSIPILAIVTLFILLFVSLNGAAIDPYDVRLSISSGYSDHESGPNGARLEFKIDVENIGTEDDTYNLTVSECDWDVTLSETSIEVREDDTENFSVYVDIPSSANGGGSVDITIKATSVNGGKSVNDTILITAECEINYAVYLNRDEITRSLSPEHDMNGQSSFDLQVTNAGNVNDTFNFEFMDDNSTQKYKHWFTLPESITLERDKKQYVTIEVEVPPFTDDRNATAGGKMKDITIIVYSKGARDNGEEDGNTTDSCLAHVDINEYYYAEFSKIKPEYKEVNGGDSYTVNVTIRSEGNWWETYSFIKDGDGNGKLEDWYEFNVTSVYIYPIDYTQVSIQVDIPEDAEADIYDLYFHAESETYWETEQEYFTVRVKETYGGDFVSGDSDSSEPERDVNMEIMVRNSGNSDHEFTLDNPILPDGWNYDWLGGNSKVIDPDSSSVFTLQIQVPEPEKAIYGLYSIEITGDREAEGGGTEPLNGSVFLNLTIEVVYGVDMSAEDTYDEAEPGESRIFKVEIKNSGNIDETYQLRILSDPGSPKSAKDWASFSYTDQGDQVTIPVGETRFLDMIVDVPEFDPENDEAEHGTYGFRVKVESTNDSEIYDEVVLELYVEEMFNVDIWTLDPSAEGVAQRYNWVNYTFEVMVRNLGNEEDDIRIQVPIDEFSGDKHDWVAMFGDQSSVTVNLQSLAQTKVTMTLMITPKTNYAIYGDFTLLVRAESQGDTAIYRYTTLYINLSAPQFSFNLTPKPLLNRSMNPEDETTIGYEFVLTNTGDHEDYYEVQVETPLGSGIYKAWIMEFESFAQIWVDEMTVPEDLDPNLGGYLGPGESIDLTLWVTPAFDEYAGFYDGITLSVESRSNYLLVEYLDFNITLIRPNIQISLAEEDFYTVPATNFQVEDDIDIHFRLINSGTDETDEFNVLFYPNKDDNANEHAGSYLGFIKVENILPGSFMDLKFTWQEIPFYATEIFIIADKPIRSGTFKTVSDRGEFQENGDVAETNELDNDATFQIGTVKGLIGDYDVSIMASKTTILLDDVDQTTIVIGVTNTGDYPDSYNLSVSGAIQGWDLSLNSSFTVFLNPDDSADFILTITEDPDSTSSGHQFTAIIIARSNTYPEVSHSVTVTGEISEDDDINTAIPIPPSAVIIGFGGAGVVACFRRRLLH